MAFGSRPIGIGNLTNLKKRVKPKPASELRKVIEENDDETAQLSVDVYETEEQLFIIAPLAGIDPDDVRIEVTDDVVVIEGDREHPLPSVENDELLVQECYFGPFSRSIVLPEAINSKRAQAEFKKSVLILSMPKLDNARTRIIKIKSTQ